MKRTFVVDYLVMHIRKKLCVILTRKAITKWLEKNNTLVIQHLKLNSDINNKSFMLLKEPKLPGASCLTRYRTPDEARLAGYDSNIFENRLLWHHYGLFVESIAYLLNMLMVEWVSTHGYRNTRITLLGTKLEKQKDETKCLKVYSPLLEHC